MVVQNYFRSTAVSQIIKTIKKFSEINFEILVNKLGVNPPYIKDSTARELIKGLIIDKQIKVDDEGNVSVC